MDKSFIKSQSNIQVLMQGTVERVAMEPELYLVVDTFAGDVYRVRRNPIRIVSDQSFWDDLMYYGSSSVSLAGFLGIE